MPNEAVLKRLQKVLWVGAALTLALATTGCETPQVSDVYSPQEWRELLATAGGWTPLPIPDSKYRAGSIVQVNDQGVRWVGDLESCRFPTENFVKPGDIPNVSFNKSKEFGADLLLNYRGVAAGPEFNKVRKVRMNVTDHSADSLNLIALRVWQEIPANRNSVSPVCFEELGLPNRFLITEAFTVSKASYTLVGESGAALKVDVPALRKFLNVEASGRFNTTADGKLVVDSPTVFGIRKALRVGNSFEILGSDSEAPESADNKIEEIFYRAHAR